MVNIDHMYQYSLKWNKELSYKATEEAEQNSAVIATDTIMDFLENGTIKNSVNFPPTLLKKRKLVLLEKGKYMISKVFCCENTYFVIPLRVLGRLLFFCLCLI